MARYHSFNPEFRKLAVELTKKKSVAEVAAIMGCAPATLYAWCKNAREGEKNLAVKPQTRSELRLLRKENANLESLKQENDMLKRKLLSISILAKDVELPF